MLSEILKESRKIEIGQIRPKDFWKNINDNINKKVLLIEQKNGWKKRGVCPVCGQNKFIPELEKFGVQIVNCCNCHLRFALSVPANPDDIYSDPSYLQSLEAGSYVRQYDYRKERFGQERTELVLQYLGDSQGKKLLDVGSGTGYFLACAAEAGFDCLGIELSDQVREWSVKKTGLKVVKKSLKEIAGEEQFDVITMFDLLEHVPEPVELLRDAKEALKDKGIIIIFTPNFDSFGISLLGSNSNLIDPVNHLTYFSACSLEKLCQICGLKIELLKTYGLDIADIIAFYEGQDHKETDFIAKYSYQLQAIIDAANAGNHIRLIARKIDNV